MRTYAVTIGGDVWSVEADDIEEALRIARDMVECTLSEITSITLTL